MLRLIFQGHRDALTGQFEQFVAARGSDDAMEFGNEAFQLRLP